MNYEVVSLAERFDLFELQDEIVCESWPEFILQDSVNMWMRLMECFKSYQLILIENDEVLAVMSTVPVYFDGDMNKLPDEGLSWGIEKSIFDFDNKIAPNMLMGAQIVVNKKYQGKGISSIALTEMKKLAAKKGFDKLILPVRPSEKSKLPLMDISEYLKLSNREGWPLDSWVRAHCKAGGAIIKICYKSMQINESIANWEKWTNQQFLVSGDYLIDGALNPVSINKESDSGIYIEPNVWILHNILQ